jgi:hypothetical protein
MFLQKQNKFISDVNVPIRQRTYYNICRFTLFYNTLLITLKDHLRSNTGRLCHYGAALFRMIRKVEEFCVLFFIQEVKASSENFFVYLRTQSSSKFFEKGIPEGYGFPDAPR